MSDASIMTDMAQDEIFSGPISESVPSSTVGFAHRRTRTDSRASFTYYEDDRKSDSQPDEGVVIADEDDVRLDEVSTECTPFETDVEAANRRPSQMRSQIRQPAGVSKTSRASVDSRVSQTSVEDPLLRRAHSTGSATSNLSGHGMRNRFSQKVYIQSEDLTIVIAGFKTSLLGYLLYLAISVLSLGLGYLLFRWLPCWRLRLVGTSCPLRSCDWVVIEVRSFCVLLQCCGCS